MHSITRRSFLGTTITGTLSAHRVLGAAGPGIPAKTIRLGLIGCGGYGNADLNAAFKAGGVEVVALADVDREHLEQTAGRVEKQQGRRPRTFKLYTELLETPDLDAVIIATPPHWHALQFMASLRRGLDIYCEKPLAYDVREGQAMVELTGRHPDRVVQVGFQRRQSQMIRQARDHIQDGKAGRIVQVEAQIHYTAGTKDTTPQDPPASLDWDLWCGPAPKLPYCPQIGHVSWRLEKEYGHGHLVDWGIHLIDAVRWTLGEGAPERVQAVGGLYYYRGKITTPDILTAHFDFKTCPVTWRHHIWGAAEYSPEVQNGIFFYGEQQTVFVTDDRMVVVPRGGKKEDQKITEARTDMGLNHMAEFLAAVRTRSKPSCSVHDAWQSTASVQLAMAAYETETCVRWDAATASIPDNEAAARLLKRDYRAPWVHPHRGA